MHKIEQYGLKFGGIVMGFWVLIGSVFFYLFVPEKLLGMLYSTMSIYILVFIGIIFYFIAKKGFSNLIETGLEPKKEKEKNN